MKKVFVLVFTLLVVVRGLSQYSVSPAPPSNGQSKDFIPSSPNASALGVYGQVPVGNYTGVAAAGVPLYTLKYRELELPIALSYHSASGIKPDNYPGSVGQGWTIGIGGITRVVRGLPDYEKTTVPDIEVPFLNNPTAEPDWSSNTKMTGYRRNGIYVLDDKNAPDEYYFNFGGMSGKFYMNHDEKFKIQTDKGTFLSVESEMVTNKKFIMPNLPQIPGLKITIPPDSILTKFRMLYAFTITDERGIKYRFGGSDSAIEFSRPGHNFADLDAALMPHYIVPMTWNLISIESPNHYKIRLNYKRGVTVTKIGYSEVQDFTWDNNNNKEPDPGTQPNKVGREKSTLMNVSYLTSIVSPKDSISFITSPASQQLKYPRDLYLDSMAYYLRVSNPPPAPAVYTPVYENHFIWYPDINYAYTQDLIPEKLDQIIVTDKNNNIFKTFQFDYTSDPAKRLKLLSVKTGSQQYKFEYNPLSLPGYVSYQTDHYGYYNGRTPYMPMRVNIDPDSLYQSKMVDTNYVRAEILQKIIYPTGGYTEFEYEPNNYSSKVNTWPFNVTENTVDAITGGVRIKKITSYDAPGKIASTKRYAYVKNYAAGGQLSSGVLAFEPSYYESYDDKPVTAPLQFSASPGEYNGTLDLRRWSSNALFPMSATRGNPVTYSEVTEINADNSFIVYKYKNYDNGYHDNTPVNYTSDNIEVKQFWKEEEGSSLSFERGQLLSEEYYNAAEVKVKKTEYQYNDDTARFNNHIRTLVIARNNMPFPSFRVTAGLTYTYFPYLKKMVAAEYFNNDSIVTTEEYAYDSTYRVLKQRISTNSLGVEQKVVNLYAQDRVLPGQTAPYDTMVKRGMVGFPVETSQYKADTLLSKQITSYVKGIGQDTSLILPASFSVQYKNHPAEVRSHNHLYNSKGNLLCESKEKGVKTCYVWGYANAFVVAKVVGVDYATVETALGGKARVDAFADSMPANDASVRSFFQFFRQDPTLASAFITTYTYNPMAGMTSETDANGKSIYYDYDQNGRLALVRDHNNHILKKLCYDYSGKPADCDTSRNSKYVVLGGADTKAIICSGNPLEIRFAPAYQSPFFNPFPDDLILLNPIDSADIIEADTLLPFSYFTDEALTIPLADGFYKVNSTGIDLWNRYFYMYKGKVLYVNGCGYADPILFKYHDSLPTPGFMCANNSLPIVAGFPGTTLTKGALLYSDYHKSKRIKNGYYEINGQYFRVANGVIDTVKLCSELPSVKTIVASYYASESSVCPAIFSNNQSCYYWGGALGVGVALYSNSSLSIPVAAGYYKLGSQYFVVNASGVITEVKLCGANSNVLQARRYASESSACGGGLILYLSYYYAIGQLGVGTVLYTDAALTLPVSSGYYKTSSSSYLVVDANGAITQMKSCFF